MKFRFALLDELGTQVEDYYKSGVGNILTQLDIVYNFTYHDSDDTKLIRVDDRELIINLYYWEKVRD